MGLDDSDLLSELRIERKHRDDHDDGGVPRWVWMVGLTVLVLVLLGGGAWWMFGARAITVETVTAAAPTSASASGAVLQATGYVTARRQATVSAQIVGTLTEVLIEEGDHVEQGQVLARLENNAYEARLDAAEAGANAADAQVAQLRVQLTQAQRDMQRQNELVERGLVPQQQAEQARTQVASLRAQLQSAQAQAVAAAAQVQVAQVNYDYTVVRAPFSGIITQKTAQVGEIIAPSAAGGGFTRTGVGTIVDMDSLEVEVDVNESYIARVEPGMPAEAVLDAYPEWVIPAHVIAIVPTADRGKATIKVRVALEEKDARVVPNMGVRVSFLEEEPADESAGVADGVLVPASAIVERDGQSVLFVVEDGEAQMRTVTPAQESYGDLKLVSNGVVAGATVVDEPPPSLADGSSVKQSTE